MSLYVNAAILIRVKLSFNGSDLKAFLRKIINRLMFLDHSHIISSLANRISLFFRNSIVLKLPRRVRKVKKLLRRIRNVKKHPRRVRNVKKLPRGVRNVKKLPRRVRPSS